jgi:Tol biopolymer transport system component
MALASGTRIGPYEVASVLGAGGMGEVYRARDTKLNRDVALKVLPPLVANDPDRLARFRREAQVLATLNDPHIAQIYGFEDSGHTHALVMELVDGPTLAQQIAQGALPVTAALAIARQIASALDAAHEQGIVHRDLKPANVKVREDGTVKVLDFGLAKALAPAGESSVDVANSPTMSAHATELGMILGTAAYMAPEQARGRPVDKRADIWAFGVVLFEMLTGRQLFTGETVSDTLAAVLRQEIDWTLLPAGTPTGVRRLLQRCLERDRRQRLRDIGDTAIALDAPDDPAATTSASAGSAQRTSRLALAVAAGVLALTAGAFWWWHGRTASTSDPAMRLSMLPSPDRPLVMAGNPMRALALSPDGTQIVYVAWAPNASQPGARQTQLEVRPLASRTVRDIPGTTGALQPFFSPDGQWVGFFTSRGELKKVSLAGGRPITLATGFNGGTWSFGVCAADGLHRVSAEGGTASTLVAVTRDPDRKGPELINSPTQTRSGGAILFSVRNGFEQGVTRIDAVRLDSGERVSVLDNANAPFVTPDGRHLLFTRDNVLLAASFDDVALKITGPAVPLVEDIGQSGPPEWALSDTGTLAYVAAIHETDTVGLVTRDGTFQSLSMPSGMYDQPRVSPDGRTIALTARTSQGGIQLFDLERGSLAKLPARGSESVLAWTPDGQSLVVTSEMASETGIALADLTGGLRMLVSGGGMLLRNASLSPDGTQLAYTRQAGSPLDIFVLTHDHPPPAPFVNSPAAEHSPRFSPDGHWLAYVSDESGRPQVYIHRYPQGPRLVVSVEGGQGPVWRRDGREIFFESVSNGRPTLMAAAITPENETLHVAAPVPLFDLRSADGDGVVESYDASNSVHGAEYDVLPDGKRFVMLRRTLSSTPNEIVVVPHWLDSLSSAGR